jgi:glycosyltransferase involved in cell wall biosynthesis
MKIALVVHQLPPEHLGGVEVYTWTLARRLVALGHCVAVFCPTDDQKAAGETEREGITLVRPYRPDPRSLGPLAGFVRTFRSRPIERAYASFLRCWRPEVIHVQSLQWVSAQLTRQHGRTPTVLTLHDYWHICANSQLLRADGSLCPGQSPSACVYCLLRGRGVHRVAAALLAVPLSPLLAWRNRYVRKSALRPDLLLTPSPQARDVCLAAGLAERPINAFDNGLDPLRFAGAPTRSAARDHAVFGYLGGLAWQKGVHVLVEAFRALPPQHELRIYGPQQTFPEYVQQLRGLATHPGIRLLGPVAPHEVGEALVDLDYLVVPSLWAETFGMVAQEAQYVGVPVIASRIGGLQRIRDGSDGLLFEPGDVAGLRRILERLAAHPEERERLAGGIRPGPTIDEQAQALVELYGHLISEAS